MIRFPGSIMAMKKRWKWQLLMLPLILIMLTITFSKCYATPECTAKLVREVFQKSPEQIKLTQESLKLIGHDTLVVDEIIGKETTAALIRFCEDLALDEVEDLPRSMIKELNKYAVFAKSEKQWRKVVTQLDFPIWLHLETERRQKYLMSIQQQGGVLPITILADYAPQPGEKTICGEKTEAEPELSDTSGVYYSLTGQDLAHLQQRGTILEQLQQLKEQEYSSKEELKGAVEEILKEIGNLNVGYYSASVLAVAQKVASYRLTKEAFDKMRLAGIPDEVLEKIQTLQDLASPSRQELFQAIESRLKSETVEDNEDIAETNSDAKVDTSLPGTEADQSVYIKSISRYIKEIVVFTLVDNSFSHLNDNSCFEAFPDEAINEISNFQDFEYLDRDQFLQAIVALYGNALSGYELLLGNLARKQSSEAITPIDWSGGSCGCSPDLPGGKVVYGLYPFWRAVETEYSRDKEQSTLSPNVEVREPQQLDFSTLTRIGYYNVYLNENGRIHSNALRHWGGINRMGDAFVRAARKYRTKLDLVVYTNAWHKWTDSQIQEAAKSVAIKAKQQLPVDLLDRLKRFVPFTGVTQATMCDGVTIYFTDYNNPKKKDKRQSIAKFIEALRLNLSKDSKGIDLNIMVRVGGEREGYIFKGLQTEALTNTEVIKEHVDLILVLLDEPTKETKKELRKAIEDEFSGDDRKLIQRKVVPVISSVIVEDQNLNGKYNQLRDNLIYFEDNFRGVGLWPLPFMTDPDTKVINTLLHQYLGKDIDEGSVDEDFLARMTMTYFPQLCNYVCPNRWLFRVVFDVLAVVLILLVLLSYMICRMRNFLREKPWVVIILLIVTICVFSASLVCDPYWKQRTDDVIVGLLAAVVVFALWRYVRRIGQGRLP